ncbi:MAG: 2-hydroxyacyl-CoA dehydratase [Candidatus Lokiarchaeota archaeon]|nr:2-hydroxyacyl-CoA dehydratase [Candidatus Lokiarchaeota archaeon]
MMNELMEYSLNRPAELIKLRAKGTKVIGYFAGDFIPEELIYAAGAIPICLLHGGDNRSVDEALAYTTRLLCPFSRAQIGQRFTKEQPYYTMLDLLISPVSCQHLRRAGDVWEEFSGVPVFRVGVGLKQNEVGAQWYADALKLMQDRLEELTGNKITHEKLKEAIEIYAKIRELLKKISLLRKSPNPSISTVDFIKLNHLSYLLAPEVMVERLESLYEELKKKKEEESNNKPRLMIVGPAIALGDNKIFSLIEDAGATVVVENFCEGVRNYWTDIDINNGNLIAALAQRNIVKRPACAFMRDSLRPSLNFILKLAKEFNIDGIIYYWMKYCETYEIESLYIIEKLQDEGIPIILLESEYIANEAQSMKTKIEGIIEIIKSKKAML